MNLEKLEAYEIIETRPVPDLNSEGAILRHKKTGARVCVLSNEDENKVFYIGFRTPPADSTGVAHINEHSVLCGSEKYPVKDPFVELAKGSLNTFLNAITYPDKTVYPVASCNDKDFSNLMDVYLDAVFHPNIYKEKKIFEQEGWHYEVDEEGNLTYNGVVYNEMKGAYSSADDVLERQIMNALYPDNPYGSDYGGTPEFIPDLTYEAFLNFHRKYYHPSNSYIYLYGNMDVEERLTYLDKEYLSHYDAMPIDSEVKKQKPFTEVKELEKEYPVLETEERENLYYYSYTVAAKGELDPEFYVALDVLDYALCSSPGAPVKMALLAAGIGEDDYSVCESGIRQPYFSFVAKNAKKEDKAQFISIIEDTLQKIAEEEIEKDALFAAINYFAFKYKEADFGSYPKGLMYGLQAMDSWLYDDKAPFLYIEQNGIFESLRKKAEEGYFEQLIRSLILENPHKAILTLIPSKTLAAEQDRKLKEKLSKYQQTLSDDEMEQIRQHAADLKAYQAQEDDPEDVKKIPMLKREDLKKEAAPFKNDKHVLTVSEKTSVDLWQHDYFTNGVSYFRLLFEITDFSDEDIFDLALLRNCIGLVSTTNFSYGKLHNEIHLKTGGITTPTSISASAKDRDKLRVFFEVKARCFEENTKDAVSLMEELLFESNFSDTDRLREILAETKAGMQASLQAAGHQSAAGRALAKLSKAGWLSDQFSGIAFSDRLSNLLSNYDEQKASLPQRLSGILQKILKQAPVTLDYTGQEQGRELLSKEVLPLLSRIEAGNEAKSDAGAGLGAGFFTDDTITAKEGLMTSSDVCYVCRAGDFKSKGLAYTGGLKVLKVLMGYDYLWLNVRVQGGAYGCLSNFLRTGYAYFVSYRDPNLEKTIEVFEGAPAYIKALDLDEDTLTKYVIGAIATQDMPMPPQAQGQRSWAALITEQDFASEQKERDEIIGCTAEQLRGLYRYLEGFLQGGILSVNGKEEQIREASGLFDSVRPMF
ncbi:MAG: insulinase family protein [Lachnospiraceae bacterium]|nr:insulinase family protein [Lachnospiraceae bacterium]